MRWAIGSILGGIVAVATIAAPSPTAAEPTRPDSLIGDLSSSFTVNEDPLLTPDVCLPDTTTASLDTVFYSYPAGIIGADYARTLTLSNGDVLWTFQDAKIQRPGGGSDVLHNIGMVQSGNCFTLLRGGSTSNPRPWLFPNETVDRKRWFWPLGAELGSDGFVYVFLADMREFPPPPPPPPPEPDPDDPDPEPEPEPEPPRDYLVNTVPQGTFVAQVDPVSWSVVAYGVPPESSTDLYGFSISSDLDWTYYFAQCHRQFGFDPYVFGILAHDRSCTDRVTVARVPKGQLFDPPRFWNGDAWVSDRLQAVPIVEQTGRFASPTQFLFRNNHWMAVTKIDDWWGKDIVVERARRAFGPYEEIQRFRPLPKCAVDCNTYFASWVTGQNSDIGDAPLTISLSHNRWDGTATSIYRPSFFSVAAPPDIRPGADRCSLGHCD